MAEDILYVVSVDARGAVREIRRVREEFAQAGQAGAQASTQVTLSWNQAKQRLSAVWQDIRSGLFMALGIGAIQEFSTALREGIQGAMADIRAMEGLRTVTASLGIAFDQAAASVARLTETGLFEEGTATQVVSRLLRAGLSIQQINELIQVGLPFVQRFREAGLSTAQAFEMLASALSRGRTMGLEYVGLSSAIVRQLEEQTAGMDDAARSAKLFEGVLQAMRQTGGDLMLDLSSAEAGIERLNVAWREAWQEIGRALLPVLRNLADTLTALMPVLHAVGSALSFLGELAGGMSATSIRVMAAAWAAWRLHLLDVAATLVGRVVPAAGAAASAISAMSPVLFAATAGIVAISEAARAFQRSLDADIERIRRDAERMAEFFRILRKAMDDLGLTSAAARRQFREAVQKALEETGLYFDTARQRIVSAGEAFRTVATKTEGEIRVLQKGYVSLAQAVAEGRVPAEQVLGALEALARTHPEHAQAVQALRRAYDELTRSERATAAASSATAAVLTDLKKQLVEIVQAFEAGRTSPLAAALAVERYGGALTRLGPILQRNRQELQRLGLTQEQINTLMSAFRQVRAHEAAEEYQRRARSLREELERHNQAVREMIRAEEERIRQMRGQTIRGLEDVVRAEREWIEAETRLQELQRQGLAAMRATDEQLSESRAAAQAAAQEVNRLAAAWQALGQALPTALGEALADALRGIGGLVQRLFSETGEVGRQLMQVFGGLGQAAGAALGAALGGPAGQAIGSALGNIVGTVIGGLISRLAGAGRRIRSLMSDWGISEQLAQQISATADRIGNTWAATMVHFGDILREKGIRNLREFNDAAVKTRQILSALDSGWISQREAVRAIGDAFQELTKAMDEMGIVGNQAVIALIRDLQHRGLKVPEVIEFINKQLDKASRGFALLADAAVRSTQVTEAQLQLLASVALATFNEAIRNGATFVEALQRIDDPLKKLRENFERLGVQVPDALAKMFRMQDLISANQDILNTIEGVRLALEGLGNIGALSVQDITNAATVLTDQFNQLIAKGFSEQEALAAIAPALDTLAKLAAQYGVELDANTQRLIEQARQQGLLGQEATNVQNMQVVLLSQIVELLGGQIPDAIKRWRDAILGVNDTLESGTARALDDVAARVRAIGSDIANWARNAPREFPVEVRAQHGFAGIVTAPTRFLVGEAGPEFVYVSPRIPSAAPATTQNGGGTPLTIQVFVDGQLTAEEVLREAERHARGGRLGIHVQALTRRR